MKRTFSQIALRIISIMQFLSALVFALLIALLFIAVDESYLTEYSTQDRYILVFEVIKLAINTILLFISWFILRKTSKDASKHNEALNITMVIIAFEVFNFISSLGRGVPRNLVTMLISIVINLITLIFIANVKKSYEEYLKSNKDN